MKVLELDKETEQRNICRMEAIIISANDCHHYVLIDPIPMQPNKGPRKKRGQGDRWHR